MPSERPATAAGTSRFGRHRHDRYFYLSFAAVSLLVVLLGFGPTYYFRGFSDSPPLPGSVHFHAIVFSGWMLLFVLQAALVEAGRTDLHRRLGMASVAFAAVLLVVGYLTAITGAQTGYLGPGVARDTSAALSFLIVPLRDLVSFAAFLAAALYYRRQPEVHKRLMLLVIVTGVLPVVSARMPGPVAMVVGLGMTFVGPVYDFWTRRRVHPAYLIGIPLLFASSILIGAIAGTQAWREIATALTR